MPKLLAIMSGLVALSALSAQAASPTAADLQIFGKDPGVGRAFACFVRHYDATHLKAHPQQNVTNMVLLVDSDYDKQSQSRGYSMVLGVNFRDVPTQFQSYGGCDGSIARQKLTCYIDCDGGAIDVRVKGANGVLVDVPYGARIEDPSAPLDAPDGGIPEKAQFGPDDKIFLLARAANALCVGLIGDEDKQALLDAK